MGVLCNQSHTEREEDGKAKQNKNGYQDLAPFFVRLPKYTPKGSIGSKEVY